MTINAFPQTDRVALDITLSSWALFLEGFSSSKLLYSFPYLLIPIKEGLLWICMLQSGACVHLLALMSRKAAKRKYMSPSAISDAADVSLNQLQTQQTVQIMCRSLAFSLYDKNEARIGEYLLILVRDKKVAEMLVNVGKFLPSLLDNKSRSGLTQFEAWATPTAI